MENCITFYQGASPKMRPFLSCHRCKVDGFVITRCSKSKVHFCMKNNQGCSNFFFNKNSKSVMSKPHFLSSVMFKIFHALWKIENSLDFFSCNCFASLMPWALRKNFYVNDIGQETRCTVFENHPKCLIEVFKNSPKLTIFGIFNKLLSTQKCQRSSLRSQCWMRLFSVIFKHRDIWYRHSASISRKCIISFEPLISLVFSSS